MASKTIREKAEQDVLWALRRAKALSGQTNEMYYVAKMLLDRVSHLESHHQKTEQTTSRLDQ